MSLARRDPTFAFEWHRRRLHLPRSKLLQYPPARANLASAHNEQKPLRRSRLATPIAQIAGWHQLHASAAALNLLDQKCQAVSARDDQLRVRSRRPARNRRAL